MVDYYWKSQFYFKSSEELFYFVTKEPHIYLGSGVSQTPIM